MRKLQIGVIGSAGREEYPGEKPNKKIFKQAHDLGKLIGELNAVLVCGGKGGIMLETCRGAKKNGGITVGVISGNTRGKSNKYVDVEVVSGLINSSEEALIVSMSDGVIAIGGGSGTLQELSLAYRNKKPVICIKGAGGWSEKLADTFLDERMLIKFGSAVTASEALDNLLKLIKNDTIKL